MGLRGKAPSWGRSPHTPKRLIFDWEGSSCQEAIAILHKYQLELETLHVKAIFLFGSVARNEANTQSDIDLLAELEGYIGLFGFAQIQRYLEKLFDCAVDLGTLDSLQPYLREQVLAEVMRIF